MTTVGNSSHQHGSVPLACNPTGKALQERLDEMRAQIFSSMVRVEELDTGYCLYFPFDQAFIMTLTDFILVETECCPFFRFDLRLQAHDDVRLKITGPQNAKMLIKSEILRN